MLRARDVAQRGAYQATVARIFLDANIKISGSVFVGFQVVSRIPSGKFLSHHSSFQFFAIAIARSMSASCVRLSPPASSKITSGPVFRAINRGGGVGQSQLSAQSVALILKEYAKAVGLNPANISGHSLRSGLVTSAVQAGVAVHKIMAQTGHRSVEMLARYIRDAGLFDSNASGAVL